MKKLPFTLCAFLCFITSYAQQYQYVPIPIDFAAWQIAGVRESSRPPHFFIECSEYNIQYMTNGIDTIINGRTYTQVWKRTALRSSYQPYPSSCPLPNTDTLVAQTPDIFAFGIREENRRVFSSKDTVNPLFDFNAIIGTDLYGFGTVIIIDTINIAGTLRQRFITSSDTLIEGVGSMKTSIDPRFFAGWVDAHHLTCHTYQNNQLYSYTYALCSVIYPAFPTKIDDAGIPGDKIYPNPFNNTIHINTKRKLFAFLYNNIGQKIIQTEVTGLYTIQTGEIKPGLYFMILKDEFGNIIKTEKLSKQ